MRGPRAVGDAARRDRAELLSAACIADERSYAVKSALAKALRATETAEGKSVLVYLLSDDDAQADALVAIGAAPWPEHLAPR